MSFFFTKKNVFISVLLHTGLCLSKCNHWYYFSKEVKDMYWFLILMLLSYYLFIGFETRLGWPQTHCIEEDSLELLFLSPPGLLVWAVSPAYKYIADGAS